MSGVEDSCVLEVRRQETPIEDAPPLRGAVILWGFWHAEGVGEEDTSAVNHFGVRWPWSSEATKLEPFKAVAQLDQECATFEFTHL